MYVNVKPGRYQSFLQILSRMRIIKLLLICIICEVLFSSASVSAATSDLGPWSAMLYCGGTAKQSFAQIITGDYSGFGETIYVAEAAYTLSPRNLFRRLFRPLLIDTVQVAGNLAYRHDYVHHDNVKEGSLYIIWRWTKFPWESYLGNSLAIGEGVSYDSHPPFANRAGDLSEDKYSRLLNYLMLEATFAIPSKPQLQLVLRMHHNCTAWGTFPKKANAGSTNVGLGVRYYF
ncbi:MAG: hypothetical protein ACD_21C00199G0003 [uncultured bacterium]|nr:MAG: hypothetical protein ACD_21C00199G0003 [uncultured bacterium]